ncbi:alpha-L-arabinofuranosidase C-terminal domain-containing protein [Parabacteroides pacaensis]|uniref:alpha-L-arabinofuranosidase C-terminal domain-containing protein n=1 Tax=Parabacteroides pacaensis TaxID=2086575 RepID=UPI000D1116CA|nr:alpha-L-arabinofuranosidase C-terminal domain-containing protein [Parabacteroides pacaensis]
MIEFVKKIHLLIILFIIAFFFFAGCRQELPVTSKIVVDTKSTTLPVNPQLYGISLEEVNHAIDGGIYAELIQNRSFEDGVVPVNCRIDFVRKQFFTPNGLVVPYCGEDSIIGWCKLSKGTQFVPDRQEVINDKNKRSLRVSVYNTELYGQGGVAAEGYTGIPLKKGEKYNLSFFIKNAYTHSGGVQVSLEKDTSRQKVSDTFFVSPVTEWRRLHYTFTATEDVKNARLVFAADSSTLFWLDVVSLFPQNTWRGRPNGLRPDLVEKIAALKPSFIRFPGGSFVEGYSSGTYPEWKETIGDIATRRSFWSFWGYGTTNGVGFHEYLQLCEDLRAEPVYVANCGITNQSRRPRYQDIMEMDKLVQDVLDAIEYANAPADSTWGALRKRNGHPEPFHLKYVEIGNENYGYEYFRRYEYFHKAIREKYPDITVISSDYSSKYRTEWQDKHFFADRTFLMSQSGYFNMNKRISHFQPVSIGSFSAVNNIEGATLQNAVGEACFMIGLEKNPDIIKQVAYAPLLANVNYENCLPAAIYFDTHRVVETPSYQVLKAFSENRGDELLKSEVTTELRPQAIFGGAGIYMFDDFYEIEHFAIDGETDYSSQVISGEWNVLPAGKLIASPNKWNYIVCGDSLAYNYVVTARIRRVKGSNSIQFRVRDNGRTDRQQNHVVFTLGPGESSLTQQSGQVAYPLTPARSCPLAMNTWYDIKVVCQDDTYSCYVNDSLLHRTTLEPIPSLVSVVTRNKEDNTIILKVVNTTYHPEKTSIEIENANVKKEAEVIEIVGDPVDRNTLDMPTCVVPRNKNITLSATHPIVYNFPPNSVTILKLKAH